eukprot:2597484-Prymnesium_polylepis.1
MYDFRRVQDGLRSRSARACAQPRTQTSTCCSRGSTARHTSRRRARASCGRVGREEVRARREGQRRGRTR